MTTPSFTVQQIRESLILKYPQFISFFESTDMDIVTPQMNFFLQDALNLLSVYADIWGELYLAGLMKLSMHLLVRGTKGENNTGTIQSIRTGDITETNYAPVSNSLRTMSTTKYGIDFEADESRVFAIYNKNVSHIIVSSL